MKRETIIVMDFGTSGIKAAVIDVNDGNLIDLQAGQYPWKYPGEGMYEIDPQEMWDASQGSLQRLLTANAGSCRFLGITFSYFGNCLLLVDRDFNPTTNIILLADKRAKETYGELMKSNPQELYMQYARQPIRDSGSAIKVLWTKRNRPETFNKTSHMFDNQQFVLSKLHLEPVNDDSMASGKDVEDMKARKWSPELLDLFEIPQSWCSQRIVDSTTVIGTIDHYGEVKFPEALPVIVGAHDTECGVMGMGALPENPGIVSDVMGTYDQIGFFTDFTNRTDFPTTGGLTVRGPFGILKSRGRGYPSLGSSMEWFVKQFVPDQDRGVFGRLLNGCRFDGRNKVIMVPLFAKEKVSINGITLSTTMNEVFCAMIEGITFECADAIRELDAMMMEDRGQHIQMLRTSGGGSRTDCWLQLRSSIFGIPVLKAAHAQAPSTGAAVMACCALGIYPSFKQASDQMVQLGPIFEPIPEQRESYLERAFEYNKFRKLVLET